MYKTTTHSIQVSVQPSFLETESEPDNNHYVWAYTIEITNLGSESVQLISRFWRITDALGRVEEVNGAGVVGEQPVIQPGETFEYTSGCPLATDNGMMVGTYFMSSEKGPGFHVNIPAFSLDLPDAVRVLN